MTDDKRSDDKGIELSVVVGLIAGDREAVTTCLDALGPGLAKYRSECIVPFDGRLKGIEELRDRFPWAEFIDATDRVDAEQFKQSREHHDILRAIGLVRAKGTVVALLEDHGTPASGWCDAVMKALAGPAAAVGGAVENGVNRLLNHAVYYCDFGRYQNPVPAGPAEFLSDSNTAYKRTALESTRHLWEQAFHETSVNWELRNRGELLELNPEMVVYQTRTTLSWGSAIGERFTWGRSFAGTRSVGAGIKRLVWASMAWILPFLLTARIVMNSVRRRRAIGRMLLVLPIIFVLQSFWAIGEFVGYVTGRTGGPSVQTS
ncbi:MAG: hypothetical protein ACYSWQ_08565 [Planctomycetota bacterium]|jgi:hypothetical protein